MAQEGRLRIREFQLWLRGFVIIALPLSFFVFVFVMVIVGLPRTM